jgi:hypothetical protein
MPTYKITSTGNIIIADQAFMDAQHPNDYTLVPDPVLPSPPPPFNTTWLMDVGSYYDEFGAAKLAVLSSSDSIIKAAISDASVRNYIDKSRSDVQAIVTYMGGTPVPGLGTCVAPPITPALANTILSTPPTAAQQVSTIAYLKSVGLP